jgi:hypothetical protein
MLGLHFGDIGGIGYGGTTIGSFIPTDFIALESAAPGLGGSNNANTDAYNSSYEAGDGMIRIIQYTLRFNVGKYVTRNTCHICPLPLLLNLNSFTVLFFIFAVDLLHFC